MKFWWLMISKCALFNHCACLTTKARVLHGRDSWDCDWEIVLKSSCIHFVLKASLFLWVSDTPQWPSGRQHPPMTEVFALAEEQRYSGECLLSVQPFKSLGYLWFPWMNFARSWQGILLSLSNMVESQGFSLSSVHHMNVQKVILDLVSLSRITVESI